MCATQKLHSTLPFLYDVGLVVRASATFALPTHDGNKFPMFTGLACFEFNFQPRGRLHCLSFVFVGVVLSLGSGRGGCSILLISHLAFLIKGTGGRLMPRVELISLYDLIGSKLTTKLKGKRYSVSR